MAWLEKRLRGAKVWVLTDEQGQPISGEDNRVDIVYRPGGKPYRASINNLQDAPGAPLLSEAALGALFANDRTGNGKNGQTIAGGERAENEGKALPLVGVSRVLKVPPLAEAIHVYTDGACTGNPGPMGIGVVILDPIALGEGRRELSAYLGMGTNNIAELTAIERGLVSLPRARPVIIYSDSSYAIGVLAEGWRARANQELVAGLRRLLSEFSRVYFFKVPGHAGVPENERCDELARQAIIRRQP